METSPRTICGRRRSAFARSPGGAVLPSPAAPGSAQSLHVPRCRSGRSSGAGMLLLTEEVRVPPVPNAQLL